MNKARFRRTSLALLVFAATGLLTTADLPAAVSPENWPQFRGPAGNPVSDNPALPASWSVTDNVDWVAEVPGVGWSSPIVWNDMIFVTGATSDQEMKQPSLGVDFSNEYVAELAAQGLSDEEVERRVNERDMEMPDAIDLRYHLFAFDLETGERTHRTRIHATASNFTSSLWAYNGMVFAINEEGDTFVMKAGEEFDLIGINSLDEFTLATPPISGGRLLIRTQGRLYAPRTGA